MFHFNCKSYGLIFLQCSNNNEQVLPISEESVFKYVLNSISDYIQKHNIKITKSLRKNNNIIFKTQKGNSIGINKFIVFDYMIKCVGDYVIMQNDCGYKNLYKAILCTEYFEANPNDYKQLTKSEKMFCDFLTEAVNSIKLDSPIIYKHPIKEHSIDIKSLETTLKTIFNSGNIKNSDRENLLKKIRLNPVKKNNKYENIHIIMYPFSFLVGFGVYTLGNNIKEEPKKP